MKLFLLSISGLILFFFGCSKERLDEYTGSAHGILVLQKVESSGNPLPGIESRKIKVFDSSTFKTDSLNCLFETTTDMQGYFTITGLQHCKRYTLLFKDTLSGISYRSYLELTPINVKKKEERNLENLKMTAKFDQVLQNKVDISTVDASGRTVPDVDVWLYKDADTRDEDTGGVFKLKTIKTDVKGKYSSFHFEAGTYYFRAIKIFLGKKIEATNVIIVPNAGLYASTIQMSAVIIPFENGIDVTVTDSLNQPKNSIQIALYNSKTLIDTIASTTTAVALKTTDANGLAKFRKLAERKYYLRIGLGAASLIDSINVNGTVISRSVKYSGR